MRGDLAGSQVYGLLRRRESLVVASDTDQSSRLFLRVMGAAERERKLAKLEISQGQGLYTGLDIVEGCVATRICPATLGGQIKTAPERGPWCIRRLTPSPTTRRPPFGIR